VGTVVFFHAHPDDEAIVTGGTIARAAAQGHRVVLVAATRGEHGEVGEGVLLEGLTLGEHRTAELEASCALLGVDRLVFLGYTDSGMMGTPENDLAGSFWTTSVEEAAHRLAAILDEERPDTVVVYDDHGNYGHPDHIQVHRVGVRAAELAGTRYVYEVTMNRDYVREMVTIAMEAGEMQPDDGPPDVDTLGLPAEQITTMIDISDLIETKREALRCHASQVSETSFFMQMPIEQFRAAFGLEWYVRRDLPQPANTAARESWLAGLE